MQFASGTRIASVARALHALSTHHWMLRIHLVTVNTTCEGLLSKVLMVCMEDSVQTAGLQKVPCSRLKQSSGMIMFVSDIRTFQLSLIVVCSAKNFH